MTPEEEEKLLERARRQIPPNWRITRSSPRVYFVCPLKWHGPPVRLELRQGDGHTSSRLLWTYDGETAYTFADHYGALRRSLWMTQFLPQTEEKATGSDTESTMTMSAARPWSLLTCDGNIWLRTPSAAQILSLRGTEIRALPTSAFEEVDARHGPFEYLGCTESSIPGRGNLEAIESHINELLRKGEQAQWVLDNIRTALGLTEIASGSSVLHAIGLLLAEHDEVVDLRAALRRLSEEP